MGKKSDECLIFFDEETDEVLIANHPGDVIF
jgi:hypothetical protein